MNKLRTTALGWLLIGASTAAPAATVLCSDSVDTASPVLSNGFGFNPSNTRNQASSINAGNVASLKLAYTHVADGFTEKKGAPSVTQQTVYFTEGRDLVAANRATGCEYWRYSGVKKSSLSGGNIMRNSAFYIPPIVPHPPVVVVGDFYGTVYGVNADTGKELWKGFLGTDASRHMITGSPQLAKGSLFVPVASKEVLLTVADLFTPCCYTHGMLHAIDPYSGKIKWTYHTATNITLNSKTGTRGPNGMSIWGTPMVDADNNAIVVGTGQNLSAPITTNSDAIVSLDMDTGKVKWVFQSTTNDSWNLGCLAPKGLDRHCSRGENNDFDFGAPPILTSLPEGGKAIIAGGKNGTVYSLNPQTGAVNWQTKLGVGGTLGGVHWGMAIDATRVYAAVTDLSLYKFNLALKDVFALTGVIGRSMAPSANAKPGIYALNLNDGSLVWEKHYKHDFQGKSYDSLFSAALSVSNDVLFAGNLNGEVKALRTSNGDELWSFNTAVPTTDVNGVSGHGGTIDSVGPVPAGTDLLVNSGYSSFGVANAWQAGDGNALFVFRLP